jgi:plasmid maintenance system antidote protein VapI
MKKEKKILDIHIGSIIKTKATEQSISNRKLSEMIHCHPSTIIDIFKRKSVNIELLWLISIALDYDFFTEIYGKSLISKVKSKHDQSVMTVIISAEKVSVERQNGITQTTQYNKNDEK